VGIGMLMEWDGNGKKEVTEWMETGNGNHSVISAHLYVEQTADRPD